MRAFSTWAVAAVSEFTLCAIVYCCGMGMPEARAQSFPPEDPCASPGSTDACSDPALWGSYWETFPAADAEEWNELHVEVDYLRLETPIARFHVEGLVDIVGFTENDVVELVIGIPGEAHDVSVRLCDYGTVLRYEGSAGSCLEFFEIDIDAGRFRAWGTHTMDPCWLLGSPPKPRRVAVDVFLSSGPPEPFPADPCDIVELWSGASSLLATNDNRVLSFVSPDAPPNAGDEDIEPPPPISTVPLDQSQWSLYATPGIILIRFKQMDESVYTTLASVGSTLEDWYDGEGDPCSAFVTAEVAAGTEVSTMEQLLEDPNVDTVFPDLILTAAKWSDDAYISYQDQYLQGWPSGEVWGTINIEDAWDLTTGSSDVRVAILDSGVDYNHDDLDSNILKDSNQNVIGKDYVHEGTPPLDSDPDGHGTGVAGIACAETHIIGDPGSSDSIAGISQSSIMPVRVLAHEYGLSELLNGRIYTALKGLRFARWKNADVINMSFGLDRWAEAWARRYRRGWKQWKREHGRAYREGIYLVAASGNEGSRQCYPARFGTVDSISATTHDSGVPPTHWGWASFSNREGIAVLAPGENIITLKNGGGRVYDQEGTSYAAPHVAGVAALLRSADPTISPRMIREEIRRNAEPVDMSWIVGWPPSYNYCGNPTTGAGLLNAGRTVRLAVPTGGSSKIVAASGPITSGLASIVDTGGMGRLPVKTFTPDGVQLDYFWLPTASKKGGELAVANFEDFAPGRPRDEIVVGGSPGCPGKALIFRTIDGTSWDPVPWREVPETGSACSRGIRVAAGNVWGGLEPELVIGRGPGGEPRVEVYTDINGQSSSATKLWDFDDAFDPAFHDGGVWVAVGDVDGNGVGELIVGSGAGDDFARVAVYDLTSPGPLGDRPPGGLPSTTVGLINPREFDPWILGILVGGWTGIDEAPFGAQCDVVVTAGDTDDDGRDEIIVGAGEGGSPEVRVFRFDDSTSPPSLLRRYRFRAYSPQKWSGVRVYAGDLDGSPGDEILVGANNGRGAQIRAFKEDGSRLTTWFRAFPFSYSRGVRVAVGDF